jgi:hypothetical protein
MQLGLTLITFHRRKFPGADPCAVPMLVYTTGADANAAERAVTVG